MWLVALLFFVLSPGVLLTLPPGSRGVFASGQTSIIAAAVHALVFMVAVYFLYMKPAESFCNRGTFATSDGCTPDSYRSVWYDAWTV